MALKAILNRESDFTGEFPAEYAKSGLWRFNESAPDEDDCFSDASGCGRRITFFNWQKTSASLINEQKGSYVRINISEPSTEKTFLRVTNDGGIFRSIGERIIVGGWIRPTTYSVGNLYCPLFSTREGMGQPIIYLSLYNGRPRINLYNASGTLILDQSVWPTITLQNAGWYFLAVVVEPNNHRAFCVVGDRASGESWVSDALTFSGELNRSCTAAIVMGMLSSNGSNYWYAGGFDDWFLDCDSRLTADDLVKYFKGSLLANGGDTSGAVDAITEPGVVTLRATNGVYPFEGTLYTAPVLCNLSGTGRVSVTSEYIPGVTSVGVVETSTSDDLDEWSDWTPVQQGFISPSLKATIRLSWAFVTDKIYRLKGGALFYGFSFWLF